MKRGLGLAIALLVGFAGGIGGCGGVSTEDSPLIDGVGDEGVCGDGALAPSEGCDDGNAAAGDGCSEQCAVEIGWFCEGEPSTCTESCGDGVRNEQEECDGDDLGRATCADVRPGSKPDGRPTCTSQCTLSPIGCELETCGNGQVDAGEECDDGNGADDDGCVRCLAATCGDGFTRAGREECDDGNLQDGDGCTSRCREEICGDRIVQPDEECDGPTGATCLTVCNSVGTQTCTADTCQLGTCAPPLEVCNAADDNCNGLIDSNACLSRVFRFWNPTLRDHMWQVNNTTPPPGYVSETFNNWFVYSNPVPNTVPLYQLYNDNDHMLARSPTAQADNGYVVESLIGYVVNDDVPQWNAAGKAPTLMCRYVSASSGDHFNYAFLEPPPFDYVREGCKYHVWGFQ